MLHEDFQYTVDEYGEPIPYAQANSAEIDVLQRTISPAFAQFIEKYGYGSLYGGLYWTCPQTLLRPVAALVFGADKAFHHNTCSVVGYSAFGKLYCWHANYGAFEIDLPQGQVWCSALTEDQETTRADVNRMSSMLIDEPEFADFLDVRGNEMFERCVAEHGPLDAGECYGFFPALGLAGTETPLRRVSNIKRLKVLEHFSILAQIQTFYLVRAGRDDVEIVREIG